MKDQPNNHSTNVNSAGQSNVLNKENWVVKKLPYTKECTPLGFLQLCADRRFHREIQEQFQIDTELEEPTDYWIHADAGGTPKMECQRTAPDYCYYSKKVRLMGWSAHGSGCGGFGEDVPDDVIQRALYVVAERKAEEYPLATHFIYFITEERDTKETIVYSMKC